MVSINGKEADLLVSALVTSCERILKTLGLPEYEEVQRFRSGDWTLRYGEFTALEKPAIAAHIAELQGRLEGRQLAKPRFRAWDTLSLGIPLLLRQAVYNLGTKSMRVSIEDSIRGLSISGHPSQKLMHQAILDTETERLKQLRLRAEQRQNSQMRLDTAKQAILVLETFPSDTQLEIESLNTMQVADAVLLWQEIERMRRMVSIVLAAMQDDDEFPGVNKSGGNDESPNLLVCSLVKHGRPTFSVLCQALAKRVAIYPMSLPKATKKVLEELTAGQIKPAPLPLSKQDVHFIRAAHHQISNISETLCHAIANAASERALQYEVKMAGEYGVRPTPRPMLVLSKEERASVLEKAISQGLVNLVQSKSPIVKPVARPMGMRR